MIINFIFIARLIYSYCGLYKEDNVSLLTEDNVEISLE